MIGVTADDTFSKDTSKGTVLVVFWADWCGPCSLLDDNLKEFALENPTTVLKMDIGKNSKTPPSCLVRAIPSMLLFKNGKECRRLVGVASKDRIHSFVTDGE